jgi:uncharacterized protein YjiS (DUF1127 family)
MLYAAHKFEALTEETEMLMMLMTQLRSFMRYRANLRTLAILSDRELSDIGLTRGDIDDAAWRASRA